MSLLSPRLMDGLGRTRLNVNRVGASSGFGERQSKKRGSGMEFADHRPYQVGDDTRHLDPHLFARLGQHFIRQYAASQQLSVTILLDASRSMAYGTPPKFDLARSLAAALAYVGLAGGDQVLLGAFVDGGVRWHPRTQGTTRAGSLMVWLEGLIPSGTIDLKHAVRASLERMVGTEGLTVLISDWCLEGIPTGLAALDDAGQELIGVHVLSPEEVEPERLGLGNVRLIDGELGHEIETVFTVESHERYREELEAWSGDIRRQIRSRQGRYLRVRSDDDLDRLVTRDWRVEGLIK